LPAPEGAQWPEGKPQWSGTSGATGTGQTATVTFNTTSSSSTDYKTVIAECGNTVTANVIVYETTMGSLGFTGDHMITRWATGGRIDDPDGSQPVWPAGDPVCYTKNTAPTMFGVFQVAPGLGTTVSGLQLRAKVGQTVIGSHQSVRAVNAALEDGAGTDGEVDGIAGGAAVPGSGAVLTLAPTLVWEISQDQGVTWYSVAQPGPVIVTMHFTDATPAAQPLYDLGLQKACGYVNANGDIAGAINTGISAEIYYDPAAGHREDLSIYGASRGECCCHANVFCILVSHVTGDSPSPTDCWGGCSDATHCHYTCNDWQPTFQCSRPGEDGAEANPHFNFHVEVSYGSGVYDPSYGLTGWASFLETAPVAPGHPVAAVQRTGSYPPATRHNVNWTCPH
jgi:hypothetical protein